MMKNLLTTLILFCVALSASAQKAVSNIDTIYYLLDTANTPVKDRMWDIGVESQYKYYAIQCPCLKFNNYPTFVFNVKDPGRKISGDQITAFNFVSLSSLIERAKKTSDLTAQTLYVFYIVEKSDANEYVSHKIRLLPTRQQVTTIDKENILPVTDKKRDSRH
ncbi:MULTISPECIES: hypothetical protein [Mucilaginibacter]|jgi:hypothetical protein|uniref:hypothetical protein n=1 Tax=Mucilaginibacter TaxID=423349 RepID=UPI0016635CD7|nr:hypothetical protein [Mucilaginibacter rubeus]GGB27640.1 hypothetical protein GCM10011500_49880 [Mucilaginibacter rubeus]